MLKDFYLNEGMREEVRTYLEQFLEEKALEKVFAKEDTSAMAEAMEVIDRAFENLEVLFPTKEDRKEQKNHSR